MKVYKMSYRYGNGDENNRVRAQKMAKVAKKMESARGNKGGGVR